MRVSNGTGTNTKGEGEEDATEKITRTQPRKTHHSVSSVPHTPRWGSFATFTLKPLGEAFGFNIIDFSTILAQKLQMSLGNGSTEPVQEPVIGLSKAATSVHNFGHILGDCFLIDRVFENDSVTFILVCDGGHG